MALMMPRETSPIEGFLNWTPIEGFPLTPRCHTTLIFEGSLNPHDAERNQSLEQLYVGLRCSFFSLVS